MDDRRSDTQVLDVGERLRETVEEIKPKLRGWLHLATFPLAFFSFIIMLVIADRAVVRVGAAVFMIAALMLFGVSALYHRGRWSDRAHAFWKRFDHANIFLMIAGSYTPFCLLLLSNAHASVLLTLVWSGAILGVLFKIFWIGAPRWLYVPLYLMLGWAAVIYLPEFVDEASVAVLVLMITGGGLYTLGAIVYGFKRPDPSPRWFGYHEVFHTLTIAAFIVHYVGVSLLAYQQR